MKPELYAVHGGVFLELAGLATDAGDEVEGTVVLAADAAELVIAAAMFGDGPDATATADGVDATVTIAIGVEAAALALDAVGLEDAARTGNDELAGVAVAGMDKVAEACVGGGWP